MSFSRYWQELYNRFNVSLELKVRMMKSEMVETLLY